MCGGVAVLDVNHSGNMDLFFTNGARLPSFDKSGVVFSSHLLRNRGDGTFEDVTARSGVSNPKAGFEFGAAAADFDNDGYPDIFVTSAGRDTLYHNNGDGTFTDVTKDSGLDTKPLNTISLSAAWFDYDNDGLLDLAVSEYTLWKPESDIVCVQPDSKVEIYCNPKRYPNVPSRLYHNLGHGKFEDVTARAGFAKSLGKGMGIAVADINRDGLMDIFIANDTEYNRLFLNRGGGRFEESAITYSAAYNENGATVSGMGADVRDIDNDGFPDIFYNDLRTQQFGLLHNDAGRGFSDWSQRSGIARLSEPFSGWSTGMVDYDNDGWKDIFSANGDVDYIGPNSMQHDTMWRNLDGRHFVDVSSELGPDFTALGYHRGSAFADLNNDGAMDIVVTGLNEKPRILLNTRPANHWVTLHLVGTRANRDAIGAEVKVTTGKGRTLYDHVSSSSGFMSSNDPRVHFGLGPETLIRDVEIRWPGGGVEHLENPSADRVIEVTQKTKETNR